LFNVAVAVAAGAKLGPYEILAPLGAGGMGEVYRARDAKLKRDVALKVLPEAFAHDPERMASFQREAEVLASLNHPNIAHIYCVEERALVMELVEGESPKGPMPFADAWKIASQIAAGLEYAHDKGIVHRDLKPANVKVTPEGVVKLLDFGLAKALAGQGEAPADLENSPTITVGGTEVGVILGTAAYMSPEQARGKPVDKRTDIWAFGVVLYELLTGERLFKGEGASETMAQVLAKEPDFARAPTKAQRLLRLCLEKDAKLRLRDIGDAKELLEEPAQAESPAHRKLPWAVAVLTTVAAMVLGALLWRPTRLADRARWCGSMSISGPTCRLARSAERMRSSRPTVCGWCTCPTTGSTRAGWIRPKPLSFPSRKVPTRLSFRPTAGGLLSSWEVS
jgi:serine/threonine-protein kinase